MEYKKQQLPFIPSRDMVLFPGIITPIYIGRDKSMKSLEKALMEENSLLLFLQKDGEKEEPSIPDDIKKVGVLVDIIQTAKLPDGTIKVLIESQKRVTLDKVIKTDEYFLGEYSPVELEPLDDKIAQALKRKLLSRFEKYVKNVKKISPKLLNNLKGLDGIGKIIDLIASNMNINTNGKQKILETIELDKRAYVLLELLEKEMEIIGIEKKINGEVKNQLTSTQKKHYLHQKMKAIQKELGEDGDYNTEIDRFEEKLEKNDYPEYVEKKMRQEIKRLKRMPSHSSDASTSRNYIELVLELPWNEATEDRLDIKKGKEILEEDHYGLKDVKERILEFLAVRKMTQKNGLNPKGSILCLVGPPGVGKTSLAKSIARSMERKFSRISLGGMKDEAEIRGHRRTYVGAMPGRIIKELKKQNTNNPVILLDEVDKLGSNMKGDPTSALLEVLDPEQNDKFSDNFLDMPFDLSNVFFIATANDLGSIPGPLRDRLEIIILNSYTEFEKMNIAKKYLVEKSQKESGLKDYDISISDTALLKIINEYTREAGVRNLKRQLDKIFRKIAKQVLEEDKKTINIQVNSIKKYLGKVKFRPNKLRKGEGKVGVVNGLAWTSVGGTTLEVQAVTLPGKGKLKLTGKLGDIMKESAQVAFSYVKSQQSKYGISEDFDEKLDTHLHFPKGATPKDGPSAGITITTALISRWANKKVRTDLGMTGEVTITGEVLPIGGVKEKAIGAHRVGIKEIILPDENRADMEDIPDEIKRDMEFHFVKTYEDVAKLAFLKE
ncbi:MAG: endopeptidase La [Fusobacteriota bacterium]